MVGPKVRSSGGGWLIDYGGIVEDVREPGFVWGARIIDDSSASSSMIDFDAMLEEDKSSNIGSLKKRNHKESCAAPGSKARREKIRRDKLNDRFTELCSIMNPGKPPITDKFVILSDAAHFIKQLRHEAKRLKESNEALQNSIKSVKGEKLELRNEKMRLKSEKERIEQMLKGSSTTTQFFTKPAATTLQPASPPALSKTIPYPNHIPTGMWQWIPTAAMDTSLDHVLRPPAA
ncbi:transcription factor bHLH115-like isoform X1 [Zingiber officinale]|uniref:transcription factor bHLH115-like isoform X1 n=2 Tax=Zingiber officinale TaxID=94328 RepID=UPI001C4C3373|nr:transcription factor bHLH115-like isoform X1 [Zingiber officinale]